MTRFDPPPPLAEMAITHGTSTNSLNWYWPDGVTSWGHHFAAVDERGYRLGPVRWIDRNMREHYVPLDVLTRVGAGLAELWAARNQGYQLDYMATHHLGTGGPYTWLERNQGNTL